MINLIDAENISKKVSLIVSRALSVPKESIDYEVQDSGGFILFRVPGWVHRDPLEQSLRASIHAELEPELRKFSVQWMVVLLGNDGEVVDEVDSITGIF